MSNREHRARGKAMALDRRDRRHRQSEHLAEERVDARHERRHLAGVRAHPLEVEPVGPDLARGGRDQRTWLRRRSDFVEERGDGADPVGVEAVLVVAEVQHVDIAVAIQGGHARQPMGTELADVCAMTNVCAIFASALLFPPMHTTGVSAEQLADEIARFLAATMRTSQAEVFQVVEEFDLSMTQLKILHILDGSERELTPSEVAQFVGLSPRPPVARSTPWSAPAWPRGATTKATGASSA